jgi:arabinogalactan oligomer/maltooligosaccharide transport system substrate-binding protein
MECNCAFYINFFIEKGEEKMKKKILSGILVAAMTVSMVACGSGDSTDTQSGTTTNGGASTDDTNAGGDTATDASSAIDELIAATDGTVTLTVWCSELEAYQTVMATLVDEFKAAYPDVTFDITIGAESEANCKDDLLNDVEAGADVFVFADDQINELVTAGALNPVDTAYTYNLSDAYGEGTLAAASVNGQLYAYPLSASNGYFLYYNTAYISEADAASWESLVAAAETAGKKVGFDFGNVWYTYGFFSGAGLTATLADDGVNTVCDWNSTSNSPTGAEVAQAIVDLCKSDAVVSVGNADAMTMMANDELVAFVDGTWDANTVKEAYGDGYAAAKLPTFQAGGQTVQMGSFAGYKFVGVNAYSAYKGWAMLLAEYITSEASQVAIYNATADGPANTAAAAQASSPELEALAAQAAYADLQRVGGNFWSSGNTLGATLFEGTDDVQAALDEAVAGITAPVE